MIIQTIRDALQSGDIAGAIRACEEELQTETDRPSRAELLNLRAVAEQVSGDVEAAVGFALRALKEEPGFAKGWNTLAILQNRAGRVIPAIDAAEAAVRADPGMVEAHLTLAGLYASRRRPRRAAESYRRALDIDPVLVPALSGLALALTQSGDAEGALSTYERLEELLPEDAGVASSIAATLTQAGRAVEAGRAALRVLELDPVNVTGLQVALQSAPPAETGDLVPTALRLARDHSAPWLRRARLLAALAYREDRLVRQDEAFRYWEEKNRVASSGRSYDRGRLDRFVQGVKTTWTPDLTSRLTGISTRRERPVLVLGMPRSGTTLVEQILGGHEKVSPGGELYDLGDLSHNFMPGQTISRVDETPEAELEGRVRQMSAIYADALAQYGDADRVVTDKMPENFKLVGLAAVLMPNLKVVHVRRDPRDVCFSIWKLQFNNEGHAYGNRFEDLAHYYRVHEELIAHWKSIFPGLIHTVRYEELVADPEPEGRRVVEHCGLDWSPDLLDFSGSGRAVRTASATQVREGLNTKGVGRWRAYEPYLTPMLEALSRERLI
jgi:tetratricopeptide (TPR) repeat protein